MIDPPASAEEEEAPARCYKDNDDSSGEDEKKKYPEEFFQQWLDKNKKELTDKVPTMDPSRAKFFQAACQHVQDCQTDLATATKKRDEIQKHKPVDKDALEKANQAVDAAAKALAQSKDDALKQSIPLLDAWDSHTMADDTHKLLLVTDVLLQATPKGLAQYCASATDDQAKALVQLLQDPRQYPLLETMVLAGGAKNGKYGAALELYNALEPHMIHPKDPVLQRLRLAVALELAEPIGAFHLDGIYIDPIHRYCHYQDAWRFGALDPVFGTVFGVWEMRMIVDSLAPDDQLAWCREMMRNYRPDHMLLADKWRYCRIVRSDVFYTGRPNWDPNRPLDFPQILSGGGECGPRAWMGRFACKAFGIPTWGVKEPGHAAMSRWTADEGWVVCLGAAMKVAWWDSEHGLHFQVDAAARKVLAPKDDLGKPNVAYGVKILAMEWIAHLNGESPGQVVRNCMPDPKALWFSLSLMQRKRIAPPPSELDDDDDIVTIHNNNTKSQPPIPQLERLLLRNQTITEDIVTLGNGTVIIPAANTSDPTKNTGNVLFMDSFLGGKQLFIKDKDGHVEYTLTSPPPGGKYQLTCHCVNVHDDKVKPPLLVTIDGGEDGDDRGDDGVILPHADDKLCSVYSVALPYTKGMWQETAPVVVEVPTGVSTCKIALSRDGSTGTARGLVLKELKLVPLKKLE
ncbi:Sulfatase-modifying factor enzyme 1 [Seminavis robusta]|uniref:Sulfatase-modifying factor enzyme 1 n=1 Tax=Seminavis robusta TaxID=568900 RepID=A0A9N8E6E3_9STRA|nr:Sulfatase-modifying factor enzyme 1 [Seminavis robusta]|eukprot:Sro699_g189510.1 Sulfatase-modifying factor enzyme 1 (685) ;mRNA; f:42380-44631